MTAVTDIPSDSDWYLREWMQNRGLKQADLIKDLGWEKPRVSKIYNSKIVYRREIVVELANWLGIRPYELLMPPSEAVALRRLRETAAEIASGMTTSPTDAPTKPRGRR